MGVVFFSFFMKHRIGGAQELFRYHTRNLALLKKIERATAGLRELQWAYDQTYYKKINDDIGYCSSSVSCKGRMSAAMAENPHQSDKIAIEG